MCREGHEDSMFIRVYEWLHRWFPRNLDCRPIYLENSFGGAGFGVARSEEITVMGVCPVKATVARPKRTG